MLSILVRIAISEDSKSRITCDAVFGLLRETSDQSVDVGFALRLFCKLNDPWPYLRVCHEKHSVQARLRSSVMSCDTVSECRLSLELKGDYDERIQNCLITPLLAWYSTPRDVPCSWNEADERSNPWFLASSVIQFPMKKYSTRSP